MSSSEQDLKTYKSEVYRQDQAKFQQKNQDAPFEINNI